MNKILMCLLCSVILFPACDRKSENTYDLDANGVDLEFLEEVSIELDSMTGFFTYDINIVDFGNGEKNIAVLNHLIQRIQIYDYETGKHIDNIQFDLVGPEGIGEKPRAFHIINRDSIFVFDAWLGRVSLIDSEGKKKGQYNLAANGLNDGFAVPQGSNQKPLLHIDNKLFMAGLLLPWEGVELNEEQFIKYDLETQDLEYLVKRPSIYNEHNWGNGVMFHMNYDFNSNRKELIFSFNNYDHLIVTDFNGNNLRTYHTPSVHFKEVEYYEEDFSYSWNAEKIHEYNFQNPRFWSVIYDQYNEVTYRFALRPNSYEKFKSGVRNMQVSLIILDKDYKKIGEYDFDREKYDSRMCFVTEKGIHFANKEKFEMNEDALVFDVFNLNNKE